MIAMWQDLCMLVQPSLTTEKFNVHLYLKAEWSSSENPLTKILQAYNFDTKCSVGPWLL